MCEILCAPFESGVSISYSSLALLKVKVSPTGLPSPVFWECFILVLVPKLGGSVLVHRLHSLGRASAVIIILYMWIICPGVLVLIIILCLLHSHTSCCGFLFIYFVVEDLSASLQVFLIKICSINCNIGVSMGGSEFKVFPVWYLRHILQIKLLMRDFTLKNFIVTSQNQCLLYIQHISLWTIHISSAR